MIRLSFRSVVVQIRILVIENAALSGEIGQQIFYLAFLSRIEPQELIPAYIVIGGQIPQKLSGFLPVYLFSGFHSISLIGVTEKRLPLSIDA